VLLAQGQLRPKYGQGWPYQDRAGHMVASRSHATGPVTVECKLPAPYKRNFNVPNQHRGCNPLPTQNNDKRAEQRQKKAFKSKTGFEPERLPLCSEWWQMREKRPVFATRSQSPTVDAHESGQSEAKRLAEKSHLSNRRQGRRRLQNTAPDQHHNRLPTKQQATTPNLQLQPQPVIYILDSIKR
jgi:hypothetical protein